MQKSKRYRTSNGKIVTIGETGYEGYLTLHDIDFGHQRVTTAAVEHWVRTAQLVELPDEQPGSPPGFIYLDEAPGSWEALSNAVGAIRPTQRCAHTNPDGSEAWVNYTPYDKNSPMAKFACAKCDKERA